MAKQFFLVAIVILVFTACDDTPRRDLPGGRAAIIAEKPYPKDREAPIDIPPPPSPYTGPKKYCFEMDLGNNPEENTRMAFVLGDNDSIHGTLDFSYADRKMVHGKIDGLKEGSFIEANYVYTDSGLNKRELLVLKLEGDKLYKKNGVMVEENGIMVLENPLMARLELFVIQTACK